MELNPLFKEIIDNLVKLLETNFQSGKYTGYGFDAPVTQSIRDATLAIRLLKTFGKYAESSVPILTRLLQKDTHWWLPGIAAEALGEIGSASEPAIPRLASLMLSDESAPKSDYGHYAAASALGKIGSSQAVPYLITAAQDYSEQGPGWRAIGSLSVLGNKAKDALPMLQQLRANVDCRDDWEMIDEAINSIIQEQT